MATVAAFYTAHALVSPCSQTFAELLPESRLINIVDDAFIADVIRNKGMNQILAKRLFHYFEAAEATGADYIFSTCSSIGDFIESARHFVKIPIVRIDAAMAEEAVRQASRIAVLATLPTTLGPTVRLVRSHAEKQGKAVTIVEGLASGAFEALQSGDMETHNRKIVEKAVEVSGEADLFMLSQGSMSPTEAAVREKTGKPVLTSLRSGIDYLKRVVEDGANPNT
jgi:aspartate/glutamate racemase